MRPLRSKLVPLTLLGLLGAALAATGAVLASGPGALLEPGTGQQAAGRQEPGAALGPDVPRVDLSQIRFDPLAFRGRPVRFVVQFRDLLADWDPHLTRFGTADWVAFRGWSDARFTWDAAVYEDSLPTLFVRRGSKLAADLSEFRPHERFEATAFVREIFLERPWIEITSIRSMPEHVGEGTILHVGRARDFMRRRQWDLALEQFERAKAAPLPAHARAELDRQIIECQQARESSTDERRP